MSYKDFVSDIYRAYNVLGVQGELQNSMDIDQWYSDHMITAEEFNSLKELNKQLSRKY